MTIIIITAARSHPIIVYIYKYDMLDTLCTLKFKFVTSYGGRRV